MPMHRRALASLVAFIAALPLAAEEPKPEIKTDPDGAVMKLVPAGPFTMGSDADEPDERPARPVTLPAFYMDVTEVTNAQYAKFCAAAKRPVPLTWEGGKFPKGQENCPVTNVTWYDAAAYAAWAGKRLPTETEWEKAARGTDGRKYAWGNDEDKGRKKHNGEGGGNEGPRPVGSYPEGASPSGCLDLMGNAWEWTADWYQPYPGNDEPSIFYGKKYKVIRGGGWVGFYGAGGARGADRARLLPYGAYDSLGFRCAKDAPGVNYDRVKDPDDDPARWTRKLDPPKPPDPPLRGPVALAVDEPAGADRDGAVVTAGIPLPAGLCKTFHGSLRDEKGDALPWQAAPTATWPDGSVRWLLLDFPASVAAHGKRTLTLALDDSAAKPAPTADEAKAVAGADAVTITTGPLRVVVSKASAAPIAELAVDRTGNRTFGPESAIVHDGLQPAFALAEYTGPAIKEEGQQLPWDTTTVRGAPVPAKVLPPEAVEIEENGPLRVAVRTAGWVVGPKDEKLLRYQFRIWVFAGSTDLRVWYTFTQLSGRPMLLLDEATLAIPAMIGHRASVRLGGAVAPHTGTLSGGQKVSLIQEERGAFAEDTAYRCEGQTGLPAEASAKAGGDNATGTRAPGWVDLRGDGGGLTVGVRNFWEQYPKRLDVEAVLPKDGRIVVGLWTGRSCYLDRGFAKTHELWIHPHGGADDPEAVATRLNAPLFAVAPPEWYCASGAFDEQVPADYDGEPFFESSIDADPDRWLKAGPWGMRNFGDAYMAGGKKGKNAFNNLEYDGSYQSFQQFFRTGLRKHLDLGVLKARHQEDIDTDHATGHPWKHSPRHTSTPAEGGHLFARGILAHYHLTGERRGLDVAREIGDWMGPDISRSRSHGNERQIGWSLYAMAAIYEATRDDKYKQAALAHIGELVREQDARGKFQIRYDNRISFFNGATGAAFLTWHRLTGDPSTSLGASEKIKESCRRHMQRALGYYPEYAGRTQWAFGWLAEQFRDPRFLDAAERTYETTMDYYAMRGAGVGQNEVQYLDYRRRFGLIKPVGKPLHLTPAQLAGGGLQRRTFFQPRAEWLIQDPDGGPLEIAVYRFWGKGPGKATISDAAGAALAALSFAPTADTGQQQIASIPSGAKGAVYRVACEGQKTLGWDVVTTRPVKAVLHAPGWQNVRVLPGRIWFEVPKGAAQVRFSYEASDEGYHGMTIYDPEGHAVAEATSIIDLGDPKSYPGEVKAAVDTGQDGKLWSADVRDVRITTVEGAGEYLADGPEAWFRP